MTMDFDWAKIGALVLGVVGTALGIHNFFTARQERNHKYRHDYALMILVLEPIVDRLVSLPVRAPSDLQQVPPLVFSAALADLDKAIEDARKDLVAPEPGFAVTMLNLRHASHALQARLDDSAVSLPECLAEVTAFFQAAWAFALIRSAADKFQMPLRDQSTRTPDNWSGDPKVKALVDRWETFWDATRSNRGDA